MKCPVCNSTELRVLDSREIANSEYTSRRRLCTKCGNIFRTHEININSIKYIINEDKTKEKNKSILFKRDILLSSIIKAAYDSDLSINDINKFIDSIEFGEQQYFTKKELAEKTMAFLKEKNRLAYVRYAAKYIDFEEKENA